jgi:phosphoglucomutase
VTQWVEARANALLREGNTGVKRLPFTAAMQAANTHQEDVSVPYVKDLRHVVDMDAIRAAGLTLGLDPLGGAAAPYWEPISSVHHVDMAVVTPTIDPIFACMTVDHDDQIRMDCSSLYAMARLVGLQDQYRLACANDPDADRRGIVTPTAGLMHPNHYPRWDSAGRYLWVPNGWGSVAHGSCGQYHGTDQAHRAALSGETVGSMTL